MYRLYCLNFPKLIHGHTVRYIALLYSILFLLFINCSVCVCVCVCVTHHAAALLIHSVSEWSRKAALLLLSVRLWSFRDSRGKYKLRGLESCRKTHNQVIHSYSTDTRADTFNYNTLQDCLLAEGPQSQTCFSRSSVVVPDSSSLLDSHRVVCPEGSGGGNSAREHIFNPATGPWRHTMGQSGKHRAVDVMFSPRQLTVTHRDKLAG